MAKLSTSSTQSASDGSALDLQQVTQEVSGKSPPPMPLDLSVSVESKPDITVLALPLDLTSVKACTPKRVEKHPVKDPEECAKMDELLSPSPQTMNQGKIPTDDMTSPSQMPDSRIQISRINLKERQTIKIMQEILDRLPTNKYAPPVVKTESNRDSDQDSNSTASIILYSWVDEPILQVSQISNGYKKPRFKLPDSLKSPWPWETVRFNVKIHGIKKHKPKY